VVRENKKNKKTTNYFARLPDRQASPSVGRASGQIMVITVLILSVTALAAGIISTSLIVSELRRVRGLSDSTKAVYAADSGIEYELYRALVDPTYTFPYLVNSDGSYPLQNGASFQTSVTGSTIRSLGQFQDSFRAFSLTY
jgi:hypothetical protein